MDKAVREEYARSDVIYKLGQIEAKLEANRTGWIEPVKRIEELLVKLEHQIDKDLSGLKAKVDVNETRLDLLEDAFTSWKGRIAGVIAIVSVAWIVVGDKVQHFIFGVM